MVFVVHVVWTGREWLVLIVVAVVVRAIVGVVVEILHQAGAGRTAVSVVLGDGARGDDEWLSV